MKELNQAQREALEKIVRLADEEFDGKVAPVCRLIGISDSVFNSISSGKYTGNVDNQLKKVIEYFRNKEMAAALKFDTAYQPTSISELVYKAIKSCQLRGGLVMIQGDAGIGKTQACMHFREENSASSIMITANNFVKSPRAILELIGKELGVPYGASSKMWAAIAEKLSDGMIIIIDEAQHLSGKTIDGIRSFCDLFADKGQTLGIALVGDNTIYSRIKKQGLHQIDNRTKDVFTFLAKNVTADDIRLIFPDIKNDAEAVNFLLGIAQISDSSIRGAQNLYQNTRKQGEVNLKSLAQTAKVRTKVG